MTKSLSTLQYIADQLWHSQNSMPFKPIAPVRAALEELGDDVLANAYRDVKRRLFCVNASEFFNLV